MNANSPFRWPAYRLLWFVNLACNTGIFLQSVAAAWALVERGASPQLVALVQTALSLPLVLISPLSGAISDAVDRRKVMIASQLVLAGAAIALGAAALTGFANAPVVLACMFLSGCSLAFNGPAFMASVSDTVPRAQLPEAVLANAVGLNLARSIGPALGGAILAAAGVVFNFLAAMVIAVLLIFLLLRWRPAFVEEQDPATPVEPLIGAISTGFRFAIKTPPIKAAISRAVLFAGAFSAVQALLPLIASTLLDGGPGLYGLLFTAYGIGALGGAFFGARLRRRLSFEALVRLCVIASALAVAVVAVSRDVWLSGAAIALAGGAWVVAFSILNTTIQLASPRRIGGRTLALYQMAVFSGVALGSWAGGLLAEGIGLEGSLLVVAAIGLATVLAGWLLPLPPAEKTNPAQ